MPCFALILAVISPRLAIIGVWLFSDIMGHAYDSWFLPFLGFFLLPWTTLTYAVMWDIGGREVTGFEWFFVILAFMADLASFAGAARGRDSAV